MRLSALAGLALLAPSLVSAQQPDTLVVAFAVSTDAAVSQRPGLSAQYMRPVREDGPVVEAVTGVPDTLASAERFVVSLDWSDAPLAGFDGDVSMVIGRDARQRHVMWIDTDNDESLSDETPLVLPHYRLRPMRAEADRQVPVVSVAYDILVGDQVVPARADITVSPYAAKPDGSPAIRANGATVYQVTLLTRRTATVEVDGSAYTLDLYTGLPRAAFDRTYVKVRVGTPGGSPDSLATYESQEALRFGAEGFRLHEVTRDGSRAVYVRTPGGYPAVGTRVGQTAPALEAPAMDGGAPVRVEDYRGRYVLLDFWGTWCAPCRAEAPNLRAAYEQFGRDRFEIVGVALDDPATLRAYAGEQGFTWPQAAVGSEPGPWTESYNVIEYPTAFLLGPDGEILAKGEALRGDALLPTLAAMVQP